MRLMLHTFRKDVRRLWPLAAGGWALLAVLANADRWRADWIPSPLEGWLNLLLTMAWACLAALVVLEEPLVGDRNFWTTRPYRWASLLGAKLLFAALAIHLPLFLADTAILAARGFSPGAYLPELLAKQILFFGAATLPALAVASLFRNFAQFVIAMFCIAAGLAFLNGGFQSFPEYNRVPGEVRHAAVRLLLAAAAIAIVWTQYARRRVAPARVLAIAATLAAASLSAWLPARAEYQALGGDAPARPEIQLRASASSYDGPRRFGRTASTIILPVAIAPGARGDRFRVPLVEVEIVAPDGSRIRSVQPSPNRPFEKIDLMAYLWTAAEDYPGDWLVLQFSKPAWERLHNARVDVRGTAAFEFYRLGDAITLPAQGAANVPQVGRCTSGVVDDRFSDPMYKVLCESPRELPRATITFQENIPGQPALLLDDHGVGRPHEWRAGLNSAITNSPAPHETWLSPLYRAQAFFRLTEETVLLRGDQWRAPAAYVSSANVTITPEIPTARALARFDFPNVSLAPLQAPQPALR